MTEQDMIDLIRSGRKIGHKAQQNIADKLEEQRNEIKRLKHGHRECAWCALPPRAKTT